MTSASPKPQPTKRPEKKSETIEVRVSYTEKLAFMEACRQAGTTASHAIRDYIDEFLNPAGNKPVKSSMIILTGFTALVGFAVTFAYFSQQSANPITTGERVMRYFDHDGDGILTTADAENTANKDTIEWLLATGDKNGDGSIDVVEVNTLTDVLIELRGTHPDGKPATGQEKVIIVPPGLTPSERQAFLEQNDLSALANAEDQARVQRLIDAVTLSGKEHKATKPD
jgi:hypothetical protein